MTDEEIRAELHAAGGESDGRNVTIPEAEYFRYQRAMALWTKEGDRLVAMAFEWSVLFQIGAWWADRPWRKG